MLNPKNNPQTNPRFKKSKIWWLVLILCVVAAVYWVTFSGFFQQDEWLSFAYSFQFESKGPSYLLTNAFLPTKGHYGPFNLLTINLLFDLFHLHYLPYAVVSLLLHLVVTGLVFYLLWLIFNRLDAAVFGSLVFGVLPATYQATAWPVADIGTHGATIFGFLSLIYFFKFLKEARRGFFIFSLVFLVIGLLFKEVIIGLPVAMLIGFYLFGSKKVTNQTAYPLALVTLMMIYVVIRLVMFFLPQSYAKTTLVTEGQPVKYLVFNMLSFPYKGVSQALIPSNIELDISRTLTEVLPKSLTGEPGTTEFDLFVEKKTAEAVSLIIFLSAAVLTYLIVRANNQLLKISFFGLVFAMLNSGIFALAPEKTGSVGFIESRDLYFLSLGDVILASSLLLTLLNKKNKKLLVAAMVFIALNIIWLSRILGSLSSEGQLRRSILSQIHETFPALNQETIFYTESDRSFYGLPPETKIMPFQSGFGQTLMVDYQVKNRLPLSFIDNNFLWGITEQGYKQDKDRGFGYFRSFDDLASFIKSHQDLLGDVVAIRYDSNSNTIVNNTDEIRGRLTGFLAEKELLDSSQFLTSATFNSDQTSLAIDKNPITYWDSRVSMSTPQSFSIDLGGVEHIAEISLLAVSKDQDRVGYEVKLSKDSKVWNSVFLVKSDPPNDQGVVKIYFNPQDARFVRVQQIGNQRYASWKINDIQVFKTID